MAKMFYTMQEAAEKIGATEGEVLQLIKDRQLREFRDGPRIMLKADQVEAYADGRHAKLMTALKLFTASEDAKPMTTVANPDDMPLHKPYEPEQKSPYWSVVEGAVQDLVENNDLEVTTYLYYVVGYIVKQLEKADKKACEEG
jgi:excisionase family DNA binding protein